MDTYSKLQEKINRAEDLEFGDILSKTIELFKKTWLNGFLMLLILVVIYIPFFIVLYIPIYQEMMEQIQNGGYDPNNVNGLVYTQSNNMKLMTLGITFVISLFSTFLIAGFYRLIKKIDFDESYSIKDLFFFLKGQYIPKVITIAAFSLMVAMLNLFLEKVLPNGLATTLSLFVTIVSSVYTTLFVVFLAFNPDLDVSSIFSLSFNLGTKKWLLIFGLAVVTGILGFLGVVACGFGILFTISIVYLPPYLIYKQIVGFDTVDSIDLIGKE